MKTKAAVLYQPQNPLVIEEVDLDYPKQGEVLVKIQAAGICRSDWHFMSGESSISLPAVLGHEGAGIVERVGPDVTRIQPGDTVIFSFVSSCGKCYFCSTNRPSICDLHMSTSSSMLDGTHRLHINGQPITPMGKVACFSQYSVVPEIACIPYESKVSPMVAALIGCSVTTGVCSVSNAARVESGSSVAIIGCGGVGINIIQGAKIAGATKIIAVDINNDALEFCKQFGATHTINASIENVKTRISELTGGLGPDYSFESYGSAETIELACEIVRKGGVVTVVGIAPNDERPTIDPVALVRQEKTIKGTYYGSSNVHINMPQIVDKYLNSELNIDSLITRTYSLDDINIAYQDLNSGLVGRGVVTEF